MNIKTFSPCFWMKPLLNRMIDKRLSGVLAWYASKHQQQCPQCREAHETLLAMQDGLAALRETSVDTECLSPDRWARIESSIRSEP